MPRPLFWDYMVLGLFAGVHGTTGFDLFEEVVSFVVHEDECGKVFDADFPDCFHSEFGVFEAFHALD